MRIFDWIIPSDRKLVTGATDLMTTVYQKVKPVSKSEIIRRHEREQWELNERHNQENINLKYQQACELAQWQYEEDERKARL